MEVDKLIEEITRIIQRHVPKGTQIILFGSWANGTAQKTSDVDLGILREEPIDNLAMTQIINEINAIPTLRKIDVVDLSTVDERFRASVMANHKVLTPTL